MRIRLVAAAAIPAALVLTTSGLASPTAEAAGPLGPFKRIVVIYQENHSFDNLYGTWGTAGRKRVDGLADADLEHTLQVRQDGLTYACLLQNDPRLTAPAPLTTRCRDSANGVTFDSHFPNRPFAIDDYIKPTDETCPIPGTSPTQFGPGGCTRDLVHRFYQEQYQLDGGRQDRYTTGSDAVGLTQGYYRTHHLPIYRYLHSANAPKYVVADRFFQAAFGGSFLNHQYLVAAAAPPWPGAVSDGSASDLHSIVDTNGMPTAYPLYKPTTAVKDAALLQACGLATTNPAVACGDLAVNTIQPTYQPFAPGVSTAGQLPPVDNTTTALTIGDRLSDAGVSWAWYAGGWDNAAGNVGGRGWTNGTGPECTDPQTNPAAVSLHTYPYCPNGFFQFHHQPFNYYQRYAPGTTQRARHLKDEADFIAAARHGRLPKVSFVKPVGAENEHPGYASVTAGSSHLVRLLRILMRSPQAKETLIIVTYDEFGGQWDHVPPPGQGEATPGPSDAFGPGTRIPALVIAKALPHSGVDSNSHDTTSIMATIEHAWNLPPVSGRDAVVSDLRSALRAAGVRF
jgi:phospholipase C